MTAAPNQRQVLLRFPSDEAFAPAEAPRYAIAVIVENGGSQGGDATGGHLAAPIAEKVLRFLLVPGTAP